MALQPLRSCQASSSLFSRSRYTISSGTTSRPFSATSKRCASEQNHYETLQVPYDASPGQIKKSFYTLAKKLHPDTSPDNKSDEAKSRFHALNDAYHVLSSAASKIEYDRSLGLLNRRGPAGHAAGPAGAARTGSYSSAAGGRSPSGLSKRRAPFRGPPPSFYAQGAWGEHGDKRARAAAAGHASSSAAGDGASSARSGSGRGFGSATDNGANAGGGGQDTSSAASDGHEAYEHGFAHWDRRAHLKSQSGLSKRFDEKRRERARERVDADEGIRVAAARDAIFRFLVLGGVLGGIMLAPFAWVRVMPAPKEAKPRKRKTGEG